MGRNVHQTCQWSRSIPLFQNMQMLTSGYLQMRPLRTQRREVRQLLMRQLSRAIRCRQLLRLARLCFQRKALVRQVVHRRPEHGDRCLPWT